MSKIPRDGIITSNGLTAEFRFIRGSTADPAQSRIETAIGEGWVYDFLLTYDPPKDLSPEAAAVVEEHKV